MHRGHDYSAYMEKVRFSWYSPLKVYIEFLCVFQDVDASEIKVQVCVYAFDLLYLNGEVRL